MNGTFYDLATALMERKLFGALRHDLLGQLAGEIVEVGAGTGADFPYYGAGAHVIAIEPDRSMAGRARRRARSAAARIEVRIADDTFLAGIAPHSVDAVVFPLSLCTIDAPSRALEQARRVLKGSGQLVVLEHVRSEGRVGRFQDAVAPLWKGAAGGCRLNRRTRDAIAEAGFAVDALRTRRISRFFFIQELLYGSAPPAA